MKILDNRIIKRKKNFKTSVGTMRTLGDIGAVRTLGTIGTMENGRNFYQNFNESREISIGPK